MIHGPNVGWPCLQIAVGKLVTAAKLVKFYDFGQINQAAEDSEKASRSNRLFRDDENQADLEVFNDHLLFATTIPANRSKR